MHNEKTVEEIERDEIIEAWFLREEMELEELGEEIE